MSHPELPSSRTQVDRLSSLLEGRQRVLLLTHDNPDPDAIAGAFCLSRLLEQHCGLNTRILYGGIIGRQINRQMVNRLRIPMLPIDAARIEDDDAVITVDTQPGFTNNSLPPNRRVLAVIDHHPPCDSPPVPLMDVRPHYGAVTTILTEYLVSAGVEMDSVLATAICFGISTETQDLGREASGADIAAFLEAFPRSDQPLLGRLRHPQRSLTFFEQLDGALHATRIRGAVATCHLGSVGSPDEVSEVADTLVDIETIEWMLCTGVHDERLVVSVRTVNRRANAGEVLRAAVGERSRAGGHGMIAGGALPLEGRPPEQVHEELIDRFFQQLGIEEPAEDLPLIDHEHEGWQLDSR